MSDELIWNFATPNFTVRVDALPEEDWDLSWDDTGEVCSGLISGRYVGFCARAQVIDSDGNVLATDYLGNCIYASLQDFASGHRDPDPLNRNCSLMRQARGQNMIICHYFPDMVRIVCDKARTTLRKHGAIRLRALQPRKQ